MNYMIRFPFLKQLQEFLLLKVWPFSSSLKAHLSLSIAVLLICLMLCSWTFAEPVEAVSLTSQWPTPWHRFASMPFSSDITQRRSTLFTSLTQPNTARRALSFEWHTESFQRNRLKWVTKKQYLLGGGLVFCASTEYWKYQLKSSSRKRKTPWSA